MKKLLNPEYFSKAVHRLCRSHAEDMLEYLRENTRGKTPVAEQVRRVAGDLLFERHDLESFLEAGVQKALRGVNTDPLTEPTIEHVFASLHGVRLTVRFRLWWGLADWDGARDSPMDEWANAPDVVDLLLQALGPGFRAQPDEVRRTDLDFAMFVWQVTGNQDVDVIPSLSASLGERFRRMLV
jgi:hypothetical protein